MNTRTWVAQQLAAAFLTSDWTAEGMTAAALVLLRRPTPPGWLGPVIEEVRARTVTPYPPSPRNVTALIVHAKAYREIARDDKNWPRAVDPVMRAPQTVPATALKHIEVPRLATPTALAEWLRIPPWQLDWFAGIGKYRTGIDRPGACHYRHLWRPKKCGPPRLIEEPKPFTKAIQRQILHAILDRVPPHAAAHGYVRGRSCRDHAAYHAGEAIVVALDMKDFFTRVPMRRVHGLFRCLGYPWAVAVRLTGLCSTATPPGLFDRESPGAAYEWESRKRFLQPHLPQGAPTSPALANLCTWRLDTRLKALAAHLNARYSRYADDLAFSGDAAFAGRTTRFLPLVARICADEGFVLNQRKTRVMGQGQAQRLTGLVVNRHANIDRQQFDRLKATLTNCVRHGPDGQNRDRHPHFRQHLDGRVTWVENVNSGRGHRLRLLFQAIDWSLQGDSVRT